MISRISVTSLAYLIVLFSFVWTACDDGWMYYDATKLCYKVELIPEGNYTTRINHCKSYGGVLGSIHNRFDNFFMRTINDSLKDHSIEFGLVYSSQTNWTFLDGTNATWFNWDDYQDPPEGIMAAGMDPQMLWWADPQYYIWGGAVLCQKTSI